MCASAGTLPTFVPRGPRVPSVRTSLLTPCCTRSVTQVTPETPALPVARPVARARVLASVSTTEEDEESSDATLFKKKVAIPSDVRQATRVRRDRSAPYVLVLALRTAPIDLTRIVSRRSFISVAQNGNESRGTGRVRRELLGRAAARVAAHDLCRAAAADAGRGWRNK